MTRKQIGAILGAVVLAVAAPILTLAVLHTLDGTAQAQGVVDFDIDPEITGNTASSLGTIEQCERVDGVGGFDVVADYTIDVVVQGDTLAPTAYDAWVTYDNTLINVLDAGTDALIKLPGAIDITTDEHGGDGRKSTDGQLDAGAFYLMGGPGTAGDGTILRIALDIDFSAGPGVVTFDFTKNVYTSGLGNHPGGKDTGLLAINQDCPAAAETWGAPAFLNTNALTDAGDDWHQQVTTDGTNWVAVWASESNLAGGTTDYNILFSRSTDAGANWSAPAFLNTNEPTDSGEDRYPAEVTTDGTNWVAVWRTTSNLAGGTTDYNILFSRSTDAGVNWSAPAFLNNNEPTDTGMDGSPQVTTDGTTWVAVWYSSSDLDGGTTDLNILFSRSTDAGANWSAPAFLNTNEPTDSGEDRYPAEVTTDGTNWVAVWRTTSNLAGGTTDYNILFSRSTDAGASWSPPAFLNTNEPTDSGDDGAPKVTTDGTSWVAVWSSDSDLDGGTTDSNILFSRSTDAGVNWSPPAFLNTNAASDSGYDNVPKVTTDGTTWVAVWQSRSDLSGGTQLDYDILYSIGGPFPVADLEKVDVYVKPFYCGDSDLDGDEATGDWVALGLGTCCDGVDNDLDGFTDGLDSKCWPFINEDQVNDVDDDGDAWVDEDPPSYPVGPQTCPWNGDDDCDGAVQNIWCEALYTWGDPYYCVDEDPKDGIDNDLDGRVDEDPANGFLGIDNDGDGLVDEDGAGRYDWNGDTAVDEEQFQGVDDDGDTSIDEDPLDSRVKTYDPIVEHEPHYLIKEVLLNNGPTVLVSGAESVTDIDAPAWRVNAKEDGLTTCTDGVSNNDNDTLIDGADPECHNPHIGEEDAGIHACNDDIDNGAYWGIGGDGKDEADDDCATASEVSVECELEDDIITIKDGVEWFIKPPANSLLVQTSCPDWYDPNPDPPNDKCVPCLIPAGIGPVNDSCLNLIEPLIPEPYGPGYCIVAYSKPEVYKELGFHQWVDLEFAVETMTTTTWPEGDPATTIWEDESTDGWVLWLWVDEDLSLDLSANDQIWMERTAHPWESSWFRVNVINPGGAPLPSMVVQEKTMLEHQYDLACDELPSLHKFKIQNAIYPPPEVIDPYYDNNFGETEMLVACTGFADGEIAWVDTPSTPWDIDVTSGIMAGVDVTAYNLHPTPNEFLVTLEAFSPGLGIIGAGGELPDTDDDDWADNVESRMFSNPWYNWSTPESLHTPMDTCNDGVDNDGGWGQDASDVKCMDTDGDGYSDGEELMFGSNSLDPAKTPEHMAFPWTCDDDVDNDGDGGTAQGSCDDDGCPAYEDDVEGDGPDTDSWDDCSIDQLTAVRPPVKCASGWGGQTGITYPGTTYEIYLAGNGDLTVRANIPVDGVTGAGFPIGAGIVFNCFAPGEYPPPQLKATIQPLDVHVLDLNTDNDQAPTASFAGIAICGDIADLQLVDWRFAPAPPRVFPIGEWYEPATEKEIYNAGPHPVTGGVRVRKSMNVPDGCWGYVDVAYAGETISVAGNTVYEIVPGSGSQEAPPGGIDLVEPTDVTAGVHKVYVQGAYPPLLPENQPELIAVFDPLASLLAFETALVHEDFGMMCYGDGDHVFWLGNQVTLANYPAECDPELGNISMDIPIPALARDCLSIGHSDTDGFADNVECYLDTDPWYKCPLWTDAEAGPPPPDNIQCPGVDCDGHDAYPLDINVDGAVTVVGDVLRFRGHVGASAPPPADPNWDQRLDLNMDSMITVVGDVLMYRGNIGECVENGPG